MADDKFDHLHGLDEPSEPTAIVDLSSLKQALTQERDQAYLIVIAGPLLGHIHKLSDFETVLGRSNKVDVQLNGVGVSRLHARVRSYGDEVYIEDLESANGTYVNGQRVTHAHQLHDGDKISLGSSTVLKFTFHDKLDESFQQKMTDAAMRDALTNAYNKGYLMTYLQTEMAFAIRHHSTLSLIMFDVDHFKPINDTYGHLAGDKILKELSALGQASVRTEDIFARYGGEEFAVVCRSISNKHAAILGERFRHSVEINKFEYEGIHIPVTVSVGIASFPENAVHTHEQLIAAADKALYHAKNTGRNRVSIAP